MNDNLFHANRTDLDDVGARMYKLIEDLYPTCRSITGDGLRASLAMVSNVIPMTITEVATGTEVYDWIVPKEWNVREAWVRSPRGDKVIDFRRSNLHLVSYSIPIHAKMPLTELRAHLHSMPDAPEWIPYRTSYYQEQWGFCLSHDTLEHLEDGEYEVFIDSRLERGHLTCGEFYLAGNTTDEVLISCHCCHPSLCNDNLSGMALAAFLGKHLSAFPLRYSYRFLFIPATIGAITWLQLNEEKVSRIKHGLVVACVGDPGNSTYKRSRQGSAEIDRAAAHVLKHSGKEYSLLDFSPYGYDERQYCSPGFNLPVGRLTRTPNGCYPQYHTSADDLELVRPEYLADSFQKYLAIIEILEHNRRYVNTNPKCEPQLGRRGLYGAVGGKKAASISELSILWVLNLSDGNHNLLDIAERSGLEFSEVRAAADVLRASELLVEVAPPTQGIPG